MNLPRDHMSVKITIRADIAHSACICGLAYGNKSGVEMDACVEVSGIHGALGKSFRTIFKGAKARDGGSLVIHDFFSCLHPVLIDGGVTNIITTSPLSVKTMRVKEVVNG